MPSLPELQLSLDRDQELKVVENLIRQKASDNRPLQILEAGCGRQWPINLKGVDFVLTGIDLDKDALEVRKISKKDLHECIHGDLRTVQLPSNAFDVIYNAYVLEHIDDADAVLRNFVSWLQPGGMIILRIPDPNSVRGFITCMTPFWAHVFYYKYILRYRNAGKAGYGPYETYYDHIVSRNGIREFCANHHLTIHVERGDGYHVHGQAVVRAAIRLVLRTVEMLSGGRLSARHSNLLYILEKTPAT